MNTCTHIIISYFSRTSQKITQEPALCFVPPTTLGSASETCSSYAEEQAYHTDPTYCALVLHRDGNHCAENHALLYRDACTTFDP